MGLRAGNLPKRTGRRTGRAHLMSEINVTPFVDVMLVLLIVFMITAPLLSVGVPIDLPKTAANPLETTQEPLTISVAKNGDLYLGENPIEVAALTPRLLAITRQRMDHRLYVRADKYADYGTVSRVLGLLNRAGFRRIALVTHQEE